MNQKSRLFFLFFFAAISVFGQSFKNEWIDYNKTYYKFKVFGFGTDATGAPANKGIVRIPYSSLDAAGLATVQSGHFQLWRDGKEVPIFVSSTGTLTTSDYLEFWGEINNGKLDAQLYGEPDYQLSDRWSLQTDTAAYFLTVNTTSASKRLVTAANNVAGNSLAPTPFFIHTVGRYYRAGDIANGFFASFGQNLFSSTYDKGEGWLSRVVRPVTCNSNTTLPQGLGDLQPYVAGPDMMMRINAVVGAQNSRVVKVLLNGEEVNLFQMDYLNYEKVEQPIPVSKISSGNATFSIINQSPSTCDEMRVSMIELTYPRQFNLSGTSVFEFALDASASGRFLKISNFNYGLTAPVLYDIANGNRYVADISDPNFVQVVLTPSTQPYQLVLTTQAGTYFKTIASFQPRSFVNYSLLNNQGDYLIISNPQIYGSGSANYVDQYRQYRSSASGGSYNAKVVDIDQLVDQFAWGIKKHPLSIKNFLRFARTNFVAAPKHVFLIGKGVTYNSYRQNESNPLVEKLNLVPTWGFPASDNLLASDDLKAVPATPIGRLSAVTPQEVGDYLAKVKQYDSAQNNNLHSLEDKKWMKNVLQIAGANDVSLGSQIDGYLQGYKTIISDTSFGANVTNFSKTGDPAGYTDAIVSFKNIYEKGSSIITYFGHSSSTSLDFNLDDPENYDNAKKYPIFIANGCSAGNHFSFENNRFSAKSTISEKFILAPGKGAIGYLASTHFGVINYLDIYTQKFYNAIGKKQYNKTAGEIIKEAIAASLLATGSMDYYSRVHAETYAWHGDPAIRFNSFALPDYAIEESEISITPSFISVADTSLFVHVKMHNLGRAVSDSVSFQLKKTGADGIERIVITRLLAPIKFSDSIVIEVPVIGNIDKGVNVFTAVVNYSNKINEITGTNNSASKSVTISEDELKPVFPFNYAIINLPTTKLVAYTANPLNAVRNYLMEIDTTALFNSPIKVSATKLSAGGVVEFDPGFTFTNDRTYYWRVSPGGLAQPNWRQFSFVYKAGLEGAQQGHVYELLQSKHVNISLDSNSRKYKFLSQNHNLFISNAMYPTSGTEDAHFSISVDGVSMMRSACLGSSIIINVFDSLTFIPWKNTTQPFGAAPVCNPGREYNFEYSYRTPAARKNAIDFLNSIPSGSFVAVRLVHDAPYNVFAANWRSDTAIYGSGKSLYHSLKNQGFSDVDSFYFPRTWAFIYQKNQPSFGPVSGFSDGIFDKMILSKNATSPRVKGVITSPVFGPSGSWSKVQWSGSMEEANNDSPVVEVIGIMPDKQEILLRTLSATQQDVDISSVSAAQYPFIKLRMKNADTITATPYQLSMWRVLYTPVREGAIAPNLYFNIPDTVGYNTSYNFNLPVGVAFKNVSKHTFDSIAVKVVLTDTLNNTFNYQVRKLRPLAPGDTAQLNSVLDVQALNGNYNVYIEVNPGLQQVEQYQFNNFLYKKIFVTRNNTLPVTLLSFNAILNGADVETSWKVALEDNVGSYVVQHSLFANSYNDIGNIQALNNGAATSSYNFKHVSVPAGKNFYRLKIIDADGAVKYSAVRLVTIDKNVDVSFYPNPLKDKLHIIVNNQGGEGVDLKIINAVGQQMWSRKTIGKVEVDVSHWLPGIYLLIADDGKTINTHKIQR